VAGLRMARVTNTAVLDRPETRERKDLRELLEKLADVGAVELKMNVPAEQRMSLRNLKIDALKGKIREVVFFDTPDLALFNAGVAIRGRRTQGRDDDTVAKLRPCLPDELAPSFRKSQNLKVEMDVTRRGHVVSASMKGERPAGTLTQVLAGALPLEKFLTKEQRSFVDGRLPDGIALRDLVPLGPTFVIVLKAIPDGFAQKVTIEQWHFPGQVPLVELSTKSVPAEVFASARAVTAYLATRGLTPTGEQEPKTRKALQFFATHTA
jgi:hypothetical protein